MTMEYTADTVATLHRSRSGGEDKMIKEGRLADLIEEFKRLPRGTQIESSIMVGGMFYSFKEVEHLANGIGMAFP
jgi:hypothetical protein